MKRIIIVNRLLPLIGMLFFSMAVFAQAGIIKSSVKSANGQPLAGATIKVEGRNTTIVSDAEGNFTLSLPAGNYTLLTSYIGTTTDRTKVSVVAGSTINLAPLMLKEALETSEVVVIGSRNKFPRSSIATAVPVDVVQMKDIKNFAQADLTQLLTYVAPSFQSARQTISDGTDHIDPSGLRGLGPDQTLILLNGKRRHNTALVNINGTVGRGSVGTDLNAIPVAAIERIEILRDGAAAQYG